MAAHLVSRQGRQLQRYTTTGGRLVVGCIPYRLSNDGDHNAQTIEVLVISSQKGHGMMFPKGGWELDETVTEAASREALEEAGVQGIVEERLGQWNYRSRSNGSIYQGIMFPMRVKNELVQWSEMGARKRRWVSVGDVLEGCEHWWMKDALEALVARLSSSNRQETIVLSFSHSSLISEKALVCSCA